MEDLTGKTLNSYQIIEPLGEGGMAAVYRAYQPSVDRYVALKVLPQHFAKDPTFVERFKQEAHLLARLQHPHIVPVYDYGEAENYTYIVMPLLKSGTISDRLTGEPLSVDEIERIIAQVGDALDYAHSQGIIHRDVKPSNILLDERDNVLLTDFGIAKLVETNINITATGGIIGTPAYMSPEQGLGDVLDARSDVYSLGIILYELATGRVPFKAETPMAVMLKHLSDPLPPPRQFKADLPTALENVILKALAKTPEERYQTAGALVEALQGKLRTATPPPIAPAETEPASTGPAESKTTVPPLATTQAPPATTLPHSPPADRNWLWLVLGASLMLTVVFGVLLWRASSPAPDQQNQPGIETPMIMVATAEVDNQRPTATLGAVAVVTETLTQTVTETIVEATASPITLTPTVGSDTPPDTEFPLPDDARDFVSPLDGPRLTFNTQLSLTEVRDFYREVFTELGLVEVLSFTAMQDGALTMRFENWNDGQEAVIIVASDLARISQDDARSVTLDVLTLQAYETEFPLLPDAQLVTNIDQQGGISYQTGYTLADLTDFYRAEFAELGFEEVQNFTLTEEDVVSVVFESSTEPGVVAVVQATPIVTVNGAEVRNVTIRFETLPD